MDLIIPTSPSPEVRDSIRSKAIESTYVMAGVIGFYDITPQLHMDMCSWIDKGSKRKLGLVPRDHLKTSIWTIANSVRRICENPNIRILIANETATNAAHFLRRIKAVWERNSLFQWLFSELVPQDFSKVKWSETEMQIPREQDFPEATIEVIGVGGAVVSRHYKLIKLDDLVGKEASESAEVMKKTIDWYQYCESLLEDPHDEIETYGTRWAYNDLYAWIEKHEAGYIDKFFRRIYHPDGSPIWPERFDAESIAHLRAKYGSFKFSCQYLNDPSDPEAVSFREAWLRYYILGGGEGMDRIILPEAGSHFRVGDLRRFGRVDPAISDSSAAARSAIVVDGVHADDRKFLLEAWARRCQPYDMIDQIFKFQEQYDCEAWGIESVGYQRVLKPILEREAERRGIWLNVVELKPDTRERKINRIRGCQPDLERGNIWVRRDHECFLEEYREFPVGATVDVLDAWAYGLHMWDTPNPNEEQDERDAEWDFERSGRSEITGY